MYTFMENASLAFDTICQKSVKGIPIRGMNIMQHEYIERIAGVNEGEYRKNPEKTYKYMQLAMSSCMIDQFIPKNALLIGKRGFSEETERKATTGLREIILDNIAIDSPEAVVEHMQQIAFPAIKNLINNYDENLCVRNIIEKEVLVQEALGRNILKCGYGIVMHPILNYTQYGYENYFMAYALYPEVIEEHFSLQADFCVLKNKAVVRAYLEGKLPPVHRGGQDIADSRGTLVDIKSLDKMWLPNFIRALEPLRKSDIRLIWHCDGNLMDMIPRFIEAGIKGFQGFQYEDGMDYEKICKMKTKDREDLIIYAGVSATRTLPFGTPDDIKRELKWLVDNGPKTGLFLGASSSVAPGVPWENLKTLLDGLEYYRINGRE